MNFQIKKLNISQIFLVLKPFEWVFFPRLYRHTKDNTWMNDYGNNHTNFRFLFIDLKIIHINYPDEQVDKNKP